jgi:hypothetical protein
VRLMALDRNWGFWAGRFLTKLEVLRLRLRLVVGVLTVSSQLRRRMLPYCPPDGAVYQYMPPHTVAPDTEGSTCRRAWHRSTAWSIHRMANRQSAYVRDHGDMATHLSVRKHHRVPNLARLEICVPSTNE